jgi:molybdopterin-dependent oxidoreductase alpha subunit
MVVCKMLHMDKTSKKLPNPENPESLLELHFTKPKTVAAGIPAVISSAKHVFGEMDIARGMKALLALNQKDGFDCPGCAWPDPDGHRSKVAEYCENGAKAIAEEATTKKLDARFFATNSVYDLAQLNDYEIGKKGRVAQPMYLPEGATHYQPISWDDAFAKIAASLNSLSSPDEAVFYTSGRTGNEAAFLYQLFAREFGTNNLPDCSNMCHESSGVALIETLGLGKGSVKLDDFAKAEVIIILGQNPGTNHPRMLSALQEAKENGATIISVNPLPETGLIGFSNPQTVKGALGIKARLTDIFLQVKLNGDMALLKAIELLLLEEEEKNPGTVFDKAFIAEKTAGYEQFVTGLKRYKAEELAAAAGISMEQVRQTADVLKKKNKIIACWAMGLTQHKNAVDTIKEVVNLLLLKGSIGKPGAGTCPVRGHSNVQGDRTMGINEKPPQKFLDSLERVYGFRPPQHHGYDVVEAIHAMHERKAKVFIAMGGNFLSATPDTVYTAEALRRTELTVHVSTKLNRSHLVTGREAMILPCCGHTDLDMMNGEAQFITCENSMGVVQMSKGSLKPISDQLLGEPLIVARLAKATLGNRSKVNWDLYMQHYDYIRNDIELTLPGFQDYNKRARILGGFYLPNGPREGTFTTANAKANFTTSDVTFIKLQPDELMMQTLRSHDQFNTTIYGLNDRYRGVYNERRVIFMNENDIQRLGFNDRDLVDLYNYHDGVERVAHKFIIIAFSIPEQCTATYFPETNVLVPINSTADKSNTPTSKMVIIKLRKHAG